MALAYLFEPTTQFQARTGANLTAGFLKVFYTQTDDAAPTYSDFAATPNEEEIVLDADGRAVVIVDDSKTYRLEVYNRNRGLLFTIDPITAMGGGGGGSMVYRVISTDGTVSIETTSSGGIVYYDLSTALTNQASKWGSRTAELTSLDGSNDWQELATVSTMGSVGYNYGWTATKDTAYDFAASVELPAGIAGAICGIDVRCDFQVDGVTVCTETGYIDPSRNVDRVSFEYKGQVTDGQKVDAKLYARCAEALTGTLVGRAFYNEECDGIVGGDNSGEIYTPGQYIDISPTNVISVTGLQPVSAMTGYVQQSAFDDCCSAMSGYVSSLQVDVSSISSVVSGITGDFTGYVPYSALSGDGSKITSISGSAIGGSDYSAGEYIDISGNTISVTGLQPVSGMSSYVEKSAFDDCCSAMSGYISSIQGDTGYISSVVSGLTGQTGDYVEKSAISAQSSIWNEASGMSGKLDNSASSLWYPMTGNPSGFLTEHQDLSGYVPVSAISAESSTWNSASAISAVIPWSALEGTGSTITAISGSAIGGSTSTGGKTYSGIDPIIVDNTADTISVKHSGLTVDETMTAYTTGTDIVIGVNTASFVPVSASSSFVPVSAISAASANWNDISSLSAYVAESAISAESSIWNSASAISAVIPWSALSGDGTSITGISGSAIGATGDYVEKSAMSVAIGSSVYAHNYEGFAQGRSCTAGEFSLAQGYSCKAYDSSMAQGISNNASSHAFVQGVSNSATGNSLVQGRSSYAYGASMAQGGNVSASSCSFAQGNSVKATETSFAQGYRTTASNSSIAIGIGIKAASGEMAVGKFNKTRDNAAFVIGDGRSLLASETHDLMVVSKDGEITMFSSTADNTGTGIMSSLRALSAAASSVIDSATVSAIASSYAESAASSKLDSSASSSFYPVDNPSGFITGVDLSEYATTSYVDSSVSGKLDTTAFNSGDFYSTSNPSGFITGVDLSPYQLTADMSGYIPTSESANYQQSSAMTAYQLSGDYAYNSALSGYIPTSESANYQPVSAMTAYQPSGDYIYASALGTGEI